MTDSATIQIGALAPLTSPGWTQAGQDLLAGMQLAASDAMQIGGVNGRALELVVRDTAANADKAATAVDELNALGVAALVGEFHSVAAQAVAGRATDLGIPFLCSSAVLNALAQQPSPWVARLAAPQSRGWGFYAEYLLAAGHRCVAVAAEPSAYWTAGAQILKADIEARGGILLELDARADPADLCNQVAEAGATSLLILAGYPEPAVELVRAVRADGRLDPVMVGAPAGQPEFAGWLEQLGAAASNIPFLRYLPQQSTALSARIGQTLAGQLGRWPSFVALEGYDAVLVLAAALRAQGPDRTAVADFWPKANVAGSRGGISFVRRSETTVWQWPHAPIQIADRDPDNPERFRVLRQADPQPT